MALPLLLLAACGENDGDDATGSGESSSAEATPSSGSPSPSEDASDAPPDAPECSEVWQADAKLPAPYVGCYEAEEFVAPTQQMCGFGKPLVTYGGSFYAVPGGRIHEVNGALDDDPGYTKDLAGCKA